MTRIVGHFEKRISVIRYPTDSAFFTEKKIVGKNRENQIERKIERKNLGKLLKITDSKI